jgi:Ca-activated chloride channel family protein
VTIFANPWLLLLLLLLPLIAFLRRDLKGPALLYSSVSRLKGLKGGAVGLASLPVILRYAALVLFILALARPQQGIAETRVNTEGVDIQLAVDLSDSMRAEDFHWQGRRENRLFVVKKVLEDFIDMRRGDRLGLTVFGETAWTQCPLTLDHGTLKTILEGLNIGDVPENQTAIGLAIASAAERLKDSEAKSKVIVLLTDGRNNVETLSPSAAAEAARALGIRIYAVGAGKKGPVPFPFQNVFGEIYYEKVEIDLDEDTLNSVADITGGRFFRAEDTEALREVYEEIDQLEKTEIESYAYYEYSDVFRGLLLGGLGLLLIEIFLSHTRLRRLP